MNKPRFFISFHADYFSLIPTIVTDFQGFVEFVWMNFRASIIFNNLSEDKS